MEVSPLLESGEWYKSVDRRRQCAVDDQRLRVFAEHTEENIQGHYMRRTGGLDNELGVVAMLVKDGHVSL